MKKDIFIDAQIANKFSGDNLSPEYKALINWLLLDDKDNPENNAHLLSSKYLFKEYEGGNRGCQHEFSICHIYSILQGQGRINKVENDQIEAFKTQYFSKSIWDNLNCKQGDSDDPLHIIIILLSDRRMALIDDDDFITDLINFPKFGKTVKAQKDLSPKFDYKNYAPQFKKIKIKK